MQRRTPGRGFDILLFAGVVTATALAVHALGVFQGPSSERALDRLPGLLASRISRNVGLASAPPGGSEHGTERERTYRVQSGDVLSRIAARHGVSLEAIAERNRLEDPDRLAVDQTLVIPAAEDGPPGVDVAAAPEPGLLARLVRRMAGEGGAPEAVPAADAPLEPIEVLLDMAEEELRSARFDSAFHTTEAAQRLLQGVPPSVAASQRARLEVVRATVHIAYGRHPEARRSLERALEAEPDLELGPDTSPRRIRLLLEAVRDGQPRG